MLVVEVDERFAVLRNPFGNIVYLVSDSEVSVNVKIGGQHRIFCLCGCPRDIAVKGNGNISLFFSLVNLYKVRSITGSHHYHFIVCGAVKGAFQFSFALLVNSESSACGIVDIMAVDKLSVMLGKVAVSVDEYSVLHIGIRQPAPDIGLGVTVKSINSGFILI